jgi:hypothetical protein
MSESLLKGLLHDILGVFSRAGNAPRNEENPSLVMFDQNPKRLAIPPFATATRAKSPSSGRLSIEAIATCSSSMLSMNLAGTVRLLPKSQQSDHLTNTALAAVLHCIPSIRAPITSSATECPIRFH